VDAETEEVLNEFSFLGSDDASSAYKSDDWGAARGSDEVSLGELAQLTVNNDSDITMDVSKPFISKSFKCYILKWDGFDARLQLYRSVLIIISVH